MSLRSLTAVAVLSSLATFTAGRAGAVEFHHSEGPFVMVHHCTCRIDGQDVELGERRCLRTADGPRAAVCVMEQNVTSWRTGGEGCPQASLPAPKG